MKWFRKLRRWVSNRFRKTPITRQPTKPVINPHQNNLRFGMIIPHTKKAQGAMCLPKQLNGFRAESEYGYGINLGVAIFPNDLTRCATRNNGGVKSAVKHLVKTGHNASFEPHKNAYNKKAEGFEVLVLKDDPVSPFYAQKFLDIMEKHFPDRKNRGIKYKSKGDRGYYNLATAKRNGMKVAILTESFFIDNYNDWISVEKMALVWKEFLGE